MGVLLATLFGQIFHLVRIIVGVLESARVVNHGIHLGNFARLRVFDLLGLFPFEHLLLILLPSCLSRTTFLLHFLLLGRLGGTCGHCTFIFGVTGL